VADNFIGGNDAYVQLDEILYSFKNWGFPIDGGTRKFFSFGSDFQRTLPGGKSAQVTMEGAYNQGNMPLVIGVVYEVHCGWEEGIEFLVSCRIDKIEYSNEIGAGGEPGGQCKVTMESEGSFVIDFT
jgi:hypothetical protein